MGPQAMGPHPFFPIFPLFFLWIPFMIAFWVLVVPRIVRVIRYGPPHAWRTADGPPFAPRADAREDRALLTLRERFASGEIDKAEYEERREVLLRDRPGML